jgi:hypothetical protein
VIWFNEDAILLKLMAFSVACLERLANLATIYFTEIGFYNLFDINQPFFTNCEWFNFKVLIKGCYPFVLLGK